MPLPLNPHVLRLKGERAIDAMHVLPPADGDVTGPAIEPVDVSGGRSDLPAERNQDGDCNQGAGDHDGDRNAHAIKCLV